MNKTTKNPHRALAYPARAIETKLGMDSVRHSISELCLGEPARDMVRDMAPSTDFDTVSVALARTAEMKEVLDSGQPLSLSGLADIRQWLVQLRTQGSYIDCEDLNAVRRSLVIACDVRDFFANPDTPYPRLAEVAAEMNDVRQTVALINRVLDPAGNIKDNASPELRDIRSRMLTIQGRISSAMRRVLSRFVAEGIVDADTKPALRDGRPVIPVASMNKRRIPGIVHDESATGKTYFIEPAEVVELNNEQRELEIEERREIIRILTLTADAMRPSLNELTATYAILTLFDFIRAKAGYAALVGAQLPQLDRGCIIEWYGARHPVLLLSLRARGRSVVPLDVELTVDKARILVVSGPNAGGKSITLKTVGINQYMLQCGILPVMDANSHAGIFDGIFVDLGDDQSLEDDLSTYSSHLRNMKFILSHGNDRSLVLIDEFGAGTEPQIGGAIAQALLAEFHAKGMWGIITTHYQNLKQFAQETPGIINGSMVYDRQLMKPTFRMVAGNPGSSFAVEIAMRTGLPHDIIRNAEKIVGSEYFNLDKYLLDINRDRRYWENKRNDIKRREKHLEEVIARYEADAENLRNQRRRIIDDAKTRADAIIAGSNAAVEQTIRAIREAEADKEATRNLRQRLAEKRKEIADETIADEGALKRAPKPKKTKAPQDAPVENGPIKIGDNVLLDKQGQPGVVTDIRKDSASVNFGVMKMTVPLSRLSRTIRKASSSPATETSSLARQTIESSRQRQLSFKTEIDVRGMRADEAIQAVTYFIDDALQFNAGRVRILHGTGTGALRMAIRQYLHTIPGVESFHDEDVRFGGAGITVVTLA